MLFRRLKDGFIENSNLEKESVKMNPFKENAKFSRFNPAIIALQDSINLKNNISNDHEEDENID